jgi:hypothetical protein
MEWQPIETAPKDGTRVLAYWPDVYEINAATQVESWYGPWAPWGSKEMLLTWQSAFEWADGDNSPTHWMPLPNPPQGYV